MQRIHISHRVMARVCVLLARSLLLTRDIWPRHDVCYSSLCLRFVRHLRGLLGKRLSLYQLIDTGLEPVKVLEICAAARHAYVLHFGESHRLTGELDECAATVRKLGAIDF